MTGHRSTRRRAYAGRTHGRLPISVRRAAAERAQSPGYGYDGLREVHVTEHGDVGVYDGIEAGMDTTAGRWQSVCEVHATIISHRTLALAQSSALEPEEWCEGGDS